MIKRKKMKTLGDILNCIAMWYLKKRDVSSLLWWTKCECLGKEWVGWGSIEHTRFVLAPKIICTDKFADIANLIEQFFV